MNSNLNINPMQLLSQLGLKDDEKIKGLLQGKTIESVKAKPENILSSTKSNFGQLLAQADFKNSELKLT